MGNAHVSNAGLRAIYSTRIELFDAGVVRANLPRTVTVLEATMWRLFDIITAVAILGFMLPFMAALAAAIYLVDPGPILYRHRRIGHQGRYFHCLKFRTMRVDSDAVLEVHLRSSVLAKMEWEATRKLRNDPRVTRLGAVLRKLSLDEFPQLINVIRGEMSIVGPRPIVEQEVQKYGACFEHYCRVRPGLTGVWQTSGRSDESYDRRITMDVSYVMRKSVLFDVWLLAKTVPVVLLSKGAY